MVITWRMRGSIVQRGNVTINTTLGGLGGRSDFSGLSRIFLGACLTGLGVPVTLASRSHHSIHPLIEGHLMKRSAKSLSGLILLDVLQPRHQP